MNKALRTFALDVLDDEHGINSEAWKSLAIFLQDEFGDIVNAVKATEGRFYLPTDVANQLRNVKIDDDDDLYEEPCAT